MTARIEDGGPAYPTSLDANGPFGGLTTRDYFAGQALPAVIAATSAGQHQPAGIERGEPIYLAIALDAYDMADSMLEARARQMDLTVGRANNG
jgi:hypothetical protein